MKQFTIRLYKDSVGEWRWNLAARNNKLIATSGEGYHNYSDCMHAVNLVLSLNHSNSLIKKLIRPSNVEIVNDAKESHE